MAMCKKKSLVIPDETGYGIKKPCMFCNTCAIIAVAVAFIAACVAIFGACIRVDFSWDSVVFSSVVIIVLAVLTYRFEKALFAARKEILASYREAEKKRLDVYGKILDAWVVGEQLLIKQEYDLEKKERETASTEKPKGTPDEALPQEGEKDS